LDLHRDDALAPQRGRDLVLALRAGLAAHGLAIAVLAFPLEDVVLDALCFASSRGHAGSSGCVMCRGGHSLVTLRTSSREVTPCSASSRPESRNERTPSLLACCAISGAVPPRRMMRCITSEMGITW